MAGKSKASTEIVVSRVVKGVVDFCIIGTTPIILNRVSEKAKHELLYPKRKTSADRAGSMKHDPYQEFLASAYTDPDPDGPTLIQHLAAAFKRGIADAALDVPGSSKAQIGRLCWVDGERVSIFGIPKMLMSITRSADMNKTPDIRTRVIIPEWACRISVSFVKPMMNETSISNLLVSAGMSQGIADWRTGKGKGTYGSYEPVGEDNAAYVHILKHGGRKAQEKAMKNVDFYDDDTKELYEWFTSEISKRGHDAAINNRLNGKAKKAELVGVSD